MMLQKSKSGRMKLLKYGLSAPMFILMLILSSATISNSKAVEVINKKAEWVMAKPATTIIPAEEQPIRSKSFNLEAAEEPGLVDATEGTLDISLPADTTRKKIFNKVDISPTFPGGEAGFATYINKTVRYTKEAKTKNIQGRTVLSFVVGLDNWFICLNQQFPHPEISKYMGEGVNAIWYSKEQWKQ
ncbi:MAG: hypothetical protein EOO63_06770 [Hymenobacter sp.]|nr:MAG: hypothetical protein EOO63_06770 [Hymenobacter sp.]